MFYDKPLEIDAEVWAELLTNKKVTTESDMKILRVVYDSKNHEIRASQIVPILNYSHHGTINLQISKFSKRVIAKTGAQAPLSKEGKPQWWHVPFLGYDDGGHFPWIMRQELVTAFKYILHKDNSDGLYSGELTFSETPFFEEGIQKQVLMNLFKRNKNAPRLCLAHYGARCTICSFDFGKVYGPIGKNKIHIHHLIPLSKIRHEYNIDPIKDLRPVCPNCHVILHSRNEPFTIEEVKAMISESSNRNR